MVVVRMQTLARVFNIQLGGSIHSRNVAEGAADAVEDAVEAVKDAFTSDDSKDDK